MVGVQLLKGLHFPVKTPFLRFLKRELRSNPHAQSLMQYYNGMNGHWVIGYWISEDAGTCVEMLSLPKPDSADYDDVLQVAFNLDQQRRMKGLKEAGEKMLQKNRDHFRSWQEAEQKRKDIREFVKRKLPVHKRDDPRLLSAI